MGDAPFNGSKAESLFPSGFANATFDEVTVDVWLVGSSARLSLERADCSRFANSSYDCMAGAGKGFVWVCAAAASEGAGDAGCVGI
jgi:hypothetical protein